MLHFADFIKKISASDDLHHNIVVLLILHELKNAGNVGVSCLFEHLKLVLVELLVDLVRQRRLLDELDGANSARLSMRAKLNRAKRACSDLLLNLVVGAKSLDGLKLHLVLEGEHSPLLFFDLSSCHSTLGLHHGVDGEKLGHLCLVGGVGAHTGHGALNPGVLLGRVDLRPLAAHAHFLDIFFKCQLIDFYQ